MTPPTPEPRLELLSVDAIGPLVRHLARNALESGRDGDPFSRARSADEPVDVEGLTTRLADTWRRSLDEPGWSRAFGLWVDGRLRGHLDLTGGALPSALHRARVGMGIERPWRDAGWGTRLLTEAIGWARGAGLHWLELGVFTHNAPARALYRKLGFVEQGLTVDAFRVDGRSIDDVPMALRLTDLPP